MAWSKMAWYLFCKSKKINIHGGNCIGETTMGEKVYGGTFSIGNCIVEIEFVKCHGLKCWWLYCETFFSCNPQPAYAIRLSLGGSEMCIRDRKWPGSKMWKKVYGGTFSMGEIVWWKWHGETSWGKMLMGKLWRIVFLEFWKIFLAKIFWVEDIFGRRYFGPKIFWAEDILDRRYFGSKIF